MTQILVTLDNGADANFLQRMIENMKGVLNTSLSYSDSIQQKDKKSDFLESLHAIKDRIDPNIIDLSDPRT